MAADKPTTEKYEEVFEDEEAPKEAQSMHRIRANSSIMQLKKILGEYPLRERREFRAARGGGSVPGIRGRPRSKFVQAVC